MRQRKGISKLRTVNSEAGDVTCGGWGMTCQMLHLTGRSVTRRQVWAKEPAVPSCEARLRPQAGKRPSLLADLGRGVEDP